MLRSCAGTPSARASALRPSWLVHRLAAAAADPSTRTIQRGTLLSARSFCSALRRRLLSRSARQTWMPAMAGCSPRRGHEPGQFPHQGLVLGGIAIEADGAEAAAGADPARGLHLAEGARFIAEIAHRPERPGRRIVEPGMIGGAGEHRGIPGIVEGEEGRRAGMSRYSVGRGGSPRSRPAREYARGCAIRRRLPPPRG